MSAVRDEAQPYYGRLDDYLRSNGIAHFSAREISNLHRRIWREGRSAEMRPAPEALWPHIVPTLQALEWLRSRINAPIYVSSGYRSRAYNRLVSPGAPNSLHVAFNAIDFRTRTHHSPLWLAREMDEHADSHTFGVGLYIAQGFVHLDTRGQIGRPAPARWPQQPRWWP